MPPPEFAYEETTGWGNFRLRCGATEISFSAVEVGWELDFHGPTVVDPGSACRTRYEVTHDERGCYPGSRPPHARGSTNVS
jgi:hypothetical protein